MNKLILSISFCLISAIGLSQSAPWLQEPFLTETNPTFQQMVDAGNLYFSNVNIHEKGSGFKIFKRWQNLMRNYVKQDGRLMSSAEINSTKRSIQTQNIAMRQSDMANWSTLGPFDYEDTVNRMSGQGRVNVITVSPHNANEYWIGTPGGGAWQSLDAGQTWSPKTDNMPNLGVSAIAIDPVDPLVIYAGTGDDDGSTFSGKDGLYKSTDGGNIWTKLDLDLNDNNWICDIYINPSNRNEIYIAGSSGFEKSTDGGQTWTSTLGGFAQSIKVKPGDWSTVYFSTRDQIFVSTNSGDTWTETTTGLPTTFIQRIMLDVSPDEPNNVYAVIAGAGSQFQGIYVSNDSGSSFTRQDDSLNNVIEHSQAFFDLDIAVDPSDASNIYTGCLNVWNSTNGISFNRINEWDKDYQDSYTHADIHQIRFFNGSLFVASDGGIYRSDDGGVNFTDLTEGLVIGEIYEINMSPIDTDHIVAGLQDNGGYAYDGNVWRNWHWSDGTANAIDPLDPNKMHGLFQTGAAYFFTSDSGKTNREFFGNGPGVFETQIAVNSIGEVFVANLFLAKRINNSWTNLFQFPSFVYAFEIAPSDDSVIYANTGVELFRSDNGGSTFTSVNTSITGFIEGISVDPTNPNTVYIITNNINSGGIYKSTDGGVNFTNINSNLTGNLPLRVLEVQPNHSDNPLYLGTDFGVYRYDDIDQLWEPFQNGLPDAIIRDLSIDNRGETMVAGTYGRGVWTTELPKFTFANDISIEAINEPNNEIGLVPFTPEVTLENEGQNSITNPTLNSTINGVNSTNTVTSTLLPGDDVIVNLNTVTNRGFYKLNVEAQITSDNQFTNNTKTVSLLLNDFGQVGQINSFESSTDALISINSSENGSMWERGIPSGTLLNAAADGNSVYGTVLNGPYTSYTRSYLYTQFYDFTNISNPELSFDMALDIANTHAFFIQYSLDDGDSWHLLGSSSDQNWYNSSEEQWQGLTSAWQGGQWSNITNTTLTNYTYDLTPWSGESSFLMRFVMDAKFNDNPSTAKEGVVLDNLTINGNTLSIDNFDDPIRVDIFPNPASSFITIRNEITNHFKIEVFNTLGKKILDDYGNGHEYQLNIQDLNSGLYFVRVFIDNHIITRKIFIE